MLKRVLGITVVLLVVGMIALTGAGIWLTQRGLPTFSQNGYVLQSEGGEVRQLAFAESENYKLTKLGYVTFEETSGDTASVEQSSFLHLEGGGVGSFSDGVLLDFNDLSTNFINNYYITEGVVITPSGEGYTAQTNSGSLTFGDHLWKLSDDRYMIQSSELTVHFSEEDERSVADFVEVRITQDGIVELLTQENQWSTISEECYIQTASGVKVYPITQIVENEEYKMSLAKLAVNTDDSIVLTEDETRRQIVPELNITGVDGADGENGTEGEAGAVGSDGMMGGGGETGGAGQTGANGASGQGGSSGADGGKGADGKDALTESTINSALPSMSITQWEVTATTLRGQITVKDVTALTGVDSSVNYAGTVTVYNQDTGEAIHCYYVEDLQDDKWPNEESGYGFEQFTNGQTEISFSTLQNALEPDTTYRLSVVAYYRMNDMIYSREFINRIFYTDSTGVILSKDTAEEDAVTIKSSVAEAYRDSVRSVQVFLLTPEQNENFTIASGDGGTNYQGKYLLEYKDEGKGKVTWFAPGESPEVLDDELKPEMSLKFPGLDSNTKYIARVYVETKTGLNTLTSQELEVQTLKTPPTRSSGGEPAANYNRATGAFEVYRPQVVDTDGGIVSYIYTVYNHAGEVVRTQEVDPVRGEPINFFLESQKEYTFKVEAVFDDNEKEVTYYLGTSDPVQSYGDKLPHILLTPSDGDYSEEYNCWEGDLVIDLTGSSSNLNVDQNHPLTLNFYADSLNSGELAFKIDLKDGTTVDVGPNGDLGTAQYSNTSNYHKVHLDLENLYKGTSYTIVVTGWLNLGDGKGSVYQNIGTTGFRTKTDINMAADWASGDGGTAISQTLKLSAADTEEDKERETYALSQLKSGSVRLELYSGTGVNKVRIAYTDITSTDQLQQLYGFDGIPVTENTFGGSLNINPSADYTLVVSSVVDGTYNKNLGYQNVFSSVANATLTITAQSTPPDLLTNPAQGVKVTPIYNEDAEKYGATYNADKPDDLLIGYKLQATYDNVQRLGHDVTYYAMEYTEFYNALSVGDPIERATCLMEVTQPISSSKDTVPGVVLLFGGEKSEEPVMEVDGCAVYYTGEAALEGNSLQGMGRGYRYVFAYTVRYSTTGSFEESQLAEYPYNHPEYSAYKEAYGAGTQFGKPIGRGKAYVLNSGMYEAPRMDPEIHTLVYSNQSSIEPSGLATEGTVTIHYKYKDLDDTITEEGQNVTKISWVYNGTEDKQDINEFPAEYKEDGTTTETIAGWYQVAIRYRITSEEGTGLVTPKLEIDRYGIDYSEIMDKLTENTNQDQDTFYLCQVPVDWAWEDEFQNYGNDIKVEADTSDLDSNVMRFKVTSSGASASATEIAEHLYAMELTFSYMDGNTNKELPPVYLPVSIDANGMAYAELATGRIANLVGKEIHYQANLLYDNGDLGWDLIEGENARFALQRINGTGENSNIFGFESYFSSATGGTSITPSGALSVHAGNNEKPLSLERLYESLQNSENPAPTYAITRYLTSAADSTQGRYYYVGHGGVDVSSNGTLDSLTGRYVIPKGCGTISLDKSNDSFELTSITPAISGLSYQPTTSQLTINKNFIIAGAANAAQEEGQGANKRTVYMAAFANREDAEALKNPVSNVAEITVTIDEDGVAKPGDGDYVLSGLNSGTSYWLAVYMKVGDRYVVLMDGATAQKAVYRFTAVAGVIIESARGLEYRNDSYFGKQMEMEFTVSPYLGFEAHYAIYSDAECKNSVYDEEEITSILQNTSTGPLTRGNCQFTLNLEPSENRNKLKPGSTYYLLVTATEVGKSEVVGQNVFPFTISPVGNVGVLIYAQEATSESITFRVALNDPQFSLMGRKEGSVQTHEGALYAVRFTEKVSNQERRILTTYDDKLYFGSELQKDFVLDKSVLKDGQDSIKQNTQYSIHVFAVPDLDHDGLVAIDEQGTELKNYEWYFEDEEETNFQNLINGIWDDSQNYVEKDGTQWIKDRFERGLKTQLTTDEGGILINENMASIYRVNPDTLQLNLAESYGVVTIGTDGKPVQSFKLVEWSVTGYAGSNTVMLSGESSVANGDTIFTQEQDAQGYDVYTYNIPATIPEGSYQITIKLYQNVDDKDEYASLSFTYRG